MTDLPSDKEISWVSD